MKAPLPEFSTGTPPERDLQRFYVHTYFIVAAAFLVTTALVLLLKESPFLHRQVWHDAGETRYRLRPFFILGSALLLVPFYQQIGLQKTHPAYLWTMLLLFPLLIGTYASVFIILTAHDLLRAPLLSAACMFAFSGTIGYTMEKPVFYKYIGYIRFLIGFGCMLLFHYFLPSSLLDWFVAVPIFWAYDFISSDDRKLQHVFKMVNPPMSYTQRLLVSSISILLIIPLSRPGGKGVILTRRWMTKWGG